MKKTVALILLIAMNFAIISIASAANVCYQISGYCNAERTFTVETKNRPILSEKITITQTKGQYEYRPAFSTSTRLKTKNGYMVYNVYYKKSGDTKWKSKKWAGKNCTLTFKKNSEYSVRVVPYSTTQLNRHFGVSGFKWKRLALWQVSKTKGIDLCN